MDRDQRKVYRLTGKWQQYAWGGYQYLPALLKIPPDGRPFAEYWMGAHDNASSRLLLPVYEVAGDAGDLGGPDGASASHGGNVPAGFELDANAKDVGASATDPAYSAFLNQLILSDPSGLLGAYTAERFGRLPYLLKILDVRDMLSIQVHPSKKDAEKAFAEENRSGTPLDSPARNYKDDNHKPELMVALSEFWLLHGFKPAGRLSDILRTTPELRFLGSEFGTGNYERLYKAVMEMEPVMVNAVLRPLLDRIVPLYEDGKLSKDSEDFWAARASLTFNEPGRIDRGIFSIYFFNLLNLHPGEAIFQDAGLPHAYLEGQNVEIMANSDNVLRGGLTAKHIDVPELMKHVRFEPTEPLIITGKTAAHTVSVFLTPAPDFELSRIMLLRGEKLTINARSIEIFFVLDGDLVVQESGWPSFERSAGQAFAAFDGALVNLEARKDSIVYRAAVPVRS